jgi:hypothetical protein
MQLFCSTQKALLFNIIPAHIVEFLQTFLYGRNQTFQLALLHCGMNTDGKHAVSPLIKESGLLGNDATLLGDRSQKFQMNVAPSSSTAQQSKQNSQHGRKVMYRHSSTS